jgi:hypothetical protein
LSIATTSATKKPVAESPGFLFWGMYFYYGEVAEIICKFEREICIEKKGVGRYFLWEGLTAAKGGGRQQQEQPQILRSAYPTNDKAVRGVPKALRSG